MTTSNPILAWLSETLSRFFSKSPAYFKVWNIVLAALVLVPQIPAFFTMFHIVIPTPLTPVWAKFISGCAAMGFFISKLTITVNEAPPTTSVKLPFTESSTPTVAK